ncbi:MAG: 5-formyltetrahydrofolate cyclo-ligase [Nitrospirae bacterium]|nr:5-formyltetrahydrofolate cyclo-ligase [Nitrospirota bacterium]
MPKAGLRQRTLRQRDALSDKERGEKSRRIQERLFALPSFLEASVVHFYLAVKSEVITEGMVRESLSRGKRVVIPVVDRPHKRITLSELKDYDRELSPGFNGIPEPHAGRHRTVPLEAVDLMIVPLVAFDGTGHRLGYGTGYYDRLLGGRKSWPILVGLAFEVQEVPSIPSESHDVAMNWVITESRVISFQNK